MCVRERESVCERKSERERGRVLHAREGVTLDSVQCSSN